MSLHVTTIPLRSFPNRLLKRSSFLRGENSLSPLFITRSSLQRLFAYHQIMPSFLAHLGVFGRREKAIDYVSYNLCDESHIDNPPPNLRLPSLGRSGCHFQLCYSLFSATLKTANPRRWSLRPLVVHHQFDVKIGTTLWVIAQGNLDMCKKVKLLTQSPSPNEYRDCSTPGKSLRASLAIHVVYAHWARKGWHGYLDALAQKVRENVCDCRKCFRVN